MQSSNEQHKQDQRYQPDAGLEVLQALLPSKAVHNSLLGKQLSCAGAVSAVVELQ